MKARFIGDPNDNFSGPVHITVWGHEFKFGDWREVEIDRFATHSHFEFDAEGEAEASPDVDDLKAQLDDLGVKYHHKAGAAKLAELLAEATEGAGE